jgi:hypothetical protein
MATWARRHVRGGAGNTCCTKNLFSTLASLYTELFYGFSGINVPDFDKTRTTVMKLKLDWCFKSEN